MSHTVHAGQVEQIVAKKLAQLQSQSRENSLRGTLAQLRQGVGRTPGDLPQLWGFFLGDLPEEMLGETEPSRAEWAVYTALTLFALHQQGRDPVNAWMSQKGMRLGTAMARLIQHPEDEKRVTRRFHVLATSSNMVELTHHMRSIVQLLRSSSIPLDYPALAEDLYWYQNVHTVASVRLRWGQDFYRRTIAEITETN